MIELFKNFQFKSNKEIFEELLGRIESFDEELANTYHSSEVRKINLKVLANLLLPNKDYYETLLPFDARKFKNINPADKDLGIFNVIFQNYRNVIIGYKRKFNTERGFIYIEKEG